MNNSSTKNLFFWELSLSIPSRQETHRLNSCPYSSWFHISLNSMRAKTQRASLTNVLAWFHPTKLWHWAGTPKRASFRANSERGTCIELLRVFLRHKILLLCISSLWKKPFLTWTLKQQIWRREDKGLILRTRSLQNYSQLQVLLLVTGEGADQWPFTPTDVARTQNETLQKHVSFKKTGNCVW